MRVGRLPESSPHLIEDAVKYIIFLVDAATLFDLALGMYDFSLVLMIAQHAQKVPDRAPTVNASGSDDWLGPKRVSAVPPGTEVLGDELPEVQDRRSPQAVRKGFEELEQCW